MGLLTVIRETVRPFFLSRFLTIEKKRSIFCVQYVAFSAAPHCIIANPSMIGKVVEIVFVRRLILLKLRVKEELNGLSSVYSVVWST